MWLLMLEAGVALFLLIFIVWWTLPTDKKPDQAQQSKPLPPKDDVQP